MLKDIDDRELSVPLYSPVCSLCANLIDYGKGRKCKAFSEIPLEIWTGKHDHTKPYKGDNGIRFKKVE